MFTGLEAIFNRKKIRDTSRVPWGVFFVAWHNNFRIKNCKNSICVGPQLGKLRNGWISASLESASCVVLFLHPVYG